MKQLIDCADQYIRQCRIKDFALLKICLCALGIIIGLSIPEKKGSGLLQRQVLYSSSVMSCLWQNS